MSYQPTSLDKKLEALMEKVEAGKVHVIDSFFIKGMHQKREAGQDFLVTEVSALEQLYNTLHP